jgi:Protein of unknown function (DUF1579)
MHAYLKGFLIASLLGAGLLIHQHHGFQAQDDKKQDAKKEAPSMPTLEPTPEHKWLAEGVGKWKATGKLFTPVGEQPMNGVQTNTMQEGGLWQFSDFKRDDGKFFGHGVTGYDPAKKKFVAIWVDNWSAALEPAEGTLSADKKVLTLTFGMTDPQSGQRMGMIETITRKDDKTHLFEMSMAGPDEKTMKILEITYTKM